MSFKKQNNNINKKGKIFTFFVVVIFSIFIGVDSVFAAKFKYSEFNWDTFYESRKSFWEAPCKDENGKVDHVCSYEILKS